MFSYLDVFIQEGQQYKLNQTLNNTYGIMFMTNVPSDLYINGQYHGRTPVRVSLSSGNYQIVAKAHGYADYKKEHHIDAGHPELNFKLSKQYISFRGEFYIDVGVRTVSTMAVGGSLGGYIRNWNIEGGYYWGLTDSEPLYWTNSQTEIEPVCYTYSPRFIFAKVGYGFICTPRMRITPQVGGGLVLLVETSGVEGNPAKDSNAVCGLVSARFNYAITEHLGMFLTPEYSFAIKESNSFQFMSKVSKDIKGYSSGLAVNVGLNIFF